MNENNEIKLDDIEQLTLLINEFLHSLNYVEEFNLLVDRENRKVEITAKFQL